MGVITISRKMGSAGSDIGREIAKRLGMRFVDKKILSAIMTEYGFSDFDEVYGNVPSFWERFDSMRAQTIGFLIKTIEAVGSLNDIVIVGRGGFGIFEDYNDVLNVRTKAPFCLRVERQMEKHGMSKKEAEIHVAQNDKVRKAFIESDFHMAYTNTQDFDLVINTGVVKPERAVDLVCDAYGTLMKDGRCDTSKSIKDIEVDPVLYEHVAGMIDSVCE